MHTLHCSLPQPAPRAGRLALDRAVLIPSPWVSSRHVLSVLGNSTIMVSAPGCSATMRECPECAGNHSRALSFGSTPDRVNEVATARQIVGTSIARAWSALLWERFG